MVDYDRRHIYKILPHRLLIALLSRIIDVQLGDTENTLTAKFKIRWWHCLGHFGFWPWRWILPGVYILEAIAQAAGVFIFLKFYQDVTDEKRPTGFFLKAIEGVDWRKEARPGNEVFLKVKFKGKKKLFVYFNGEPHVNREGGELLAKIETVTIFLTFKKK